MISLSIVMGETYSLLFFSIIMNELRSADFFLAYRTTVLAFINAMLIATEDFNERRNLRNEFIGLGLLEELQLLRQEDADDEDLLIQVSWRKSEKYFSLLDLEF